ncbi:hypothetical protein SUGI_0296260 [Cryptomeria japonica]|uniref:uncharacterized protein LOC131066996 n=1 Tax=Cryptomeria japonica TaxID=3369 RepID=UPI002408C8FA|nr:uncharacterized protein LOC131066996 [Cryptomeria japonica]GLJ17120.1 hypothetical protein SUGI_0296260 [Cryptomeria japonica]
MVPEGSFPLDLKIPSKGLSWVDLMCQKFETICEGVDKSPPAIIQETTRLIDQISTVGANMQKLCSDFMDDILPPITEFDDKYSCSKFSAKSEQDLDLTGKSDPGEDVVEFSFCEDLDKNSSALVQEATKSIADQMIMAGENVQKFSSDLMEDMFALVKNIDDKCPSLKLASNAEEDLKRSDPEKAIDETLSSENVDSSDVYQEADAAIEIQTLDVIGRLNASCIHEEIQMLDVIDRLNASCIHEEMQMLDVIDRLNASCIHEENVSVKSTEDLSQAKTIECYSGGDASEGVFEDKGSLQERNCLQENAEHLISQINIPLQLDAELLSNRTGGVGVAEQGESGIMDLAGRIKSEDHPRPGETLLLEDGIMEIVLKEYENVEQNHLDEDVERVLPLSVAELDTAISPTCSMEGNFKKSLYLAVKEKEQAACWYGSPHVQACKDIDMASSNSFVDITDSCRWPDVESSDSEWELL